MRYHLGLRAFVAVVLSSVCVISEGALAQPAGAGGMDALVPVKVQAATVQSVHDGIEGIGVLSARASVDITATVTDTVSAIHFEDGQRVEQGEPLLEMTSDEEHAQIAELRSTLQEAKAQYARAVQLVKDKTLSASVADERKRDFETARAKLVAMESRMKDRLILAPFSGVLGLRQVSVGALLQPGTLITTLDDDAVMYCDFSVPAGELEVVRKGLTVNVQHDAFPQRSFAGEVLAVDGRLDAQTRLVKVRARLPNQDGALRSGMSVRVSMVGTPREALVIPEGAVVPLGSEHYVFVVKKVAGSDKATVEKQKISVRKRHGDLVEVSAGLHHGDAVVTEGTMLLTQGKAVQVLPETKAAAQPEGAK